MEDAGGATTQYQQVDIQLRTLQTIFHELEDLETREDELDHVNAIRYAALTCQMPLREFNAKVEKFEKSLSPFSSSDSLRSAARMAQWDLFVAEEVQRLYVSLTGSIMSLILLMQSHSRQLYLIRNET